MKKTRLLAIAAMFMMMLVVCSSIAISAETATHAATTTTGTTAAKTATTATTTGTAATSTGTTAAKTTATATTTGTTAAAKPATATGTTIAGTTAAAGSPVLRPSGKEYYLGNIDGANTYYAFRWDALNKQVLVKYDSNGGYRVGDGLEWKPVIGTGAHKDWGQLSDYEKSIILRVASATSERDLVTRIISEAGNDEETRIMSGWDDGDYLQPAGAQNVYYDNVLKTLPTTVLLYSGITLYEWLIRNNWQMGWVRISAICWCLFNLPQILTKRYEIEKQGAKLLGKKEIDLFSSKSLINIIFHFISLK